MNRSDSSDTFVRLSTILTDIRNRYKSLEMIEKGCHIEMLLLRADFLFFVCLL